MRIRLALGLGLAALVAGCGATGPSSAERVVRAWSHALNAGDNRAAASLFAPGAKVVQAGQVLRLSSRADAVRFNAGLLCSGRIVALSSHGDTATATFRLGDRKMRLCDGPGQRATAVFRVSKGKIVLWHQLEARSAPQGPVV